MVRYSLRSITVQLFIMLSLNLFIFLGSDFSKFFLSLKNSSPFYSTPAHLTVISNGSTFRRELRNTSAFYIPSASLIVISIGSTSRQELSHTQAANLGNYVKIYQFSEANVAECLLCDPKHKGIPHPELGNSRRRATHSSGWWCAQKRPLMAVYEVLKHINQIPDLLMLIDDDTFVNPVALQKFVYDSKKLVDKPAYIGHSAKKSARIVMGGGGAVITRAVLDAWKGKESAHPWAPLRWCIEQTQGGMWCNWHSDWSFGMCVHKWSGAKATNMRNLFNQRKQPCTRKHVTCHYHASAEEWSYAWKRIFPNSSSGT